MSLQPGDVIVNGKYRILRLIGEGGMARVWLAEEPKFGGRRVAIKEPLPARLDEDGGQELARRFQQEINLAPQLEAARVPNVVRSYTLETLEDGTQLLVMAYVAGGSVADLIQAHPEGLPVPRAAAIARDVLAALHGFHDLPAAPVHRDVKPDNILLDSDEDRAHLADFGLAQLSGQSGRSKMLGRAHPGTPLYMAPEQGRSPDPLAPAADLYALGCVLFEMLTGQRYKRLRPGTPAGALRAEVPAWLDGVLARALAEEPWDRWASAREMAAALESGQAEEQARLKATAQAEREAEERAHQALRQAEEQARREAEAQSRRQAEERARQAAQMGAGPRRRVPAWAWVLVVILAVLALAGGLGLALDGGGDRSTPEAVVVTREVEKTVIVEASANAEPETGDPRTRAADGMEVVYVPAGEFRMGSSDSDSDAVSDEKPQHTVYLDAFWIDRTEVTNAQYRQCVEAGSCRAPTTCDWGESTYENGSKADHPAVCVSWEDAEDYCQWAGARLPTEAEWEKAARGTDGQIYPWGDAFDCAKGNFDDETEEDDYVVPGGEGCDGYAKTAPVGSFPQGANPYGVLDMAGNVWEWVADWYDGSYYEQFLSENPKGPNSGDRRVLRGGSWGSYRYGARSAYRYFFSPVNRDDYVGFRCGMSSTSSP